MILGDNWRYKLFLKGLVKFMETGNFEDFVLFSVKFEFEVKNW